MKARQKILGGYLIVMASIAPASQVVSTAPYPSLEDVSGLEMAFDFRLKSPKKAALFLKLIHETYRDTDLSSMANAPRFVIVFNAEAVALIAKDGNGFDQNDVPYLKDIASRIELMAKDGIRMEGCLKAAALFKIDPDLFYDEIEDVNNAWISLAGYEAKQFSMIPIY